MQRGQFSHEIFSEHGERSEIVKISKSLATHLHDKRIPNIVFVDRQARPAYLGMLKAWHSMYPLEQPPKIYFINPHGLKGGPISPAVVSEFKKVHPMLAKSTNQPVMIFDTCLHTGRTMQRLNALLEAAGFKNIRLGITQPQDSDKDHNVSFIALRNSCTNNCYPYSYECLVVSDGTDLISRPMAALPPAHISHYLKGGRLLRTEISEIMRRDAAGETYGQPSQFSHLVLESVPGLIFQIRM